MSWYKIVKSHLTNYLVNNAFRIPKTVKLLRLTVQFYLSVMSVSIYLVLLFISYKLMYSK